MSVSVQAEDYAKLVKRLREVDKKVARAARKRLREAAGPIGRFVLVAAAENMPARGGYRARLLGATLRPYLESRGAGVKLSHRGVDIRSLERGILRHPKWPGDRPRSDWRWDEQDVPAERFAEALQHLPAAQRDRFNQVAADIIKELGI